jgi:hypothetical protein
MKRPTVTKFSFMLDCKTRLFVSKLCLVYKTKSYVLSIDKQINKITARASIDSEIHNMRFNILCFLEEHFSFSKICVRDHIGKNLIKLTKEKRCKLCHNNATGYGTVCRTYCNSI